MKCNTLIVDSSASKTDLCEAGKKYGTDKSPYHTGSYYCPVAHPYTAVYDLLFASSRYKEVRLGEIGIAQLASMRCWREYFPCAKLYGFEFDLNLIEAAVSDNFMDVRDADSIDSALSDAGGNFDVLIDDSIHDIDSNSTVINVAYKYLNTGGILISEDVLRSYPCEEYMSKIEPVVKYFSLITFITTEHESRNFDLEGQSHYLDDRLLVLIRNDTPCSLL
jgi:hypothetical protein